MTATVKNHGYMLVKVSKKTVEILLWSMDWFELDEERMLQNKKGLEVVPYYKDVNNGKVGYIEVNDKYIKVS